MPVIERFIFNSRVTDINNDDGWNIMVSGLHMKFYVGNDKPMVNVGDWARISLDISNVPVEF